MRGIPPPLRPAHVRAANRGSRLGRSRREGARHGRRRHLDAVRVPGAADRAGGLCFLASARGNRQVSPVQQLAIADAERVSGTAANPERTNTPLRGRAWSPRDYASSSPSLPRSSASCSGRVATSRRPGHRHLYGQCDPTLSAIGRRSWRAGIHCRFTPTCSRYGARRSRNTGVAKGIGSA